MRSEPQAEVEPLAEEPGNKSVTRANNPLRELREDEEALRPVSMLGALHRDGVETPVVVCPASRHSLYAAFPLGGAPTGQATFDKLTLHLGESEVALTRCEFQALPHQGQYAGKLLFLDDVVDCAALVRERRVITTRNAYSNLSLVIAKKDEIRRDFREYAIDLCYELSAYKKFFDEQDELLVREPEDVRRTAMQALRRGEGRAFFDAFDQQLDKLDRLVQGFDKEQYQRHGFYLRRVAWEFIKPSEFLRRTNLKPRGYAGDADMMTMAYRNEFIGETTFGKLMHKHPLETPAAEAVRARRLVVAGALRGARNERPNDRLRFLSVACGPVAELSDIYLSPDDCGALECVLLDQDPYALTYAAESVRATEEKHGRRLDVTYVNESVRTMLRKQQPMQSLGKFDVIYSMGLFDYLTPMVAQAVLKRMYEMLAPGGSVVIGNFHVGNPTRHYMAYWMDWVLYHRTESDMHELASKLSGASTQLCFDPTGCQMFLTVRKA